MARPDAQRLTTIDEVLAEVVKPARWPERTDVAIAARHLHGEPVPWAEAVAGEFVPFHEGDAWGPDWDTTWFHVTGTVPEAWAGRACVLVVHLGYGGGTGFGAEGQVWVDGRPTQGISPNHREVVIAEPAAGGEAFDLHVEAASNPQALQGRRGELLLADPQGEPRLVLRRCHLAVVDRQVESLVRRWTLVRECVTWLGGDRADEAAVALDAACRRIEADGVSHESVATAVEALERFLGRAGGDADRPEHLAVGNSHLDTAWLWPLRETRRKAVRTFSTASTFLDRDDGYRFVASQPAQFAWIRDDQPALWERIRGHVDAGRFEAVGAMWVEPDCNLPSGESLVRQLVHGKRFWRDELGVDSDGLWLPDVFGYSAAMPQILAAAGVTWFLTQKLSWNDTNRFPHQTFWWEGIDGTRIFTHFPPADTYNGDLSVANLLHAERTYAQRDVLGRSIYLYGHGDGGGGPDADMLERTRLLEDLDGIGRVRRVRRRRGHGHAALGGRRTRAAALGGRAVLRAAPGHVHHPRRRQGRQPRAGAPPLRGRAVVARRPPPHRRARARGRARRVLEGAPPAPVPRHHPGIVDPLGLRGHPRRLRPAPGRGRWRARRRPRCRGRGGGRRRRPPGARRQRAALRPRRAGRARRRPRARHGAGVRVGGGGPGPPRRRARSAGHGR
ncbi:MAG: hypothetical protein R2702_00430 [Acidimicrobiales bacterium]